MTLRKRGVATIVIWLLMSIIALAITASSVVAADVAVITNGGNAIDVVDGETIKNIYLGKKTSWDDGSAIEFVVLESGDAHTDFLKTYVRKSVSQFDTYWKKQVFTGKGSKPKSFGSEAELIAYVAGKDGVIGYVSSAADVSSVKVVNK